MRQDCGLRSVRSLHRAAVAAALLAGLALVSPGSGNAQTAQDDVRLIARGREIAAGRCARCHAVDRTDESPQRDVVAFRDLPARFPVKMLMETATTGIISGHEEMPMTALGREDVDALLAFIDSFAPAGGPRYLKK